jgi:C4-dicarboxylate transporter, DctM subunit
MIAVKFVASLFAFITSSVPVGVVLVALGLVISAFWLPFDISPVLGITTWETLTNYILIAIPLFIMLGALMLQSGTATRMYNALVPWLNRLPGGLMHTNIVACAIFAATSGSSVATAATVGTIAIPEIKKRGYNERLFLGTLAAGGTLGILIPPSINMIVYGALTNTSIPKLYLAGFIPGILLAGMFMLTVVVMCLIRPEWGGEKIVADWESRVKGLPHLLPPLGLFIVVVGSIYAGVATPTEASALGILAAMGITAYERVLKFEMLHRAFESTLKATGMIMFLLIGAYFLNFGLGALGFVQKLSAFVGALPFAEYVVLAIIIAVYIVLGCVLDGISLIVLTVPVIAPVATNLGYDPVWFGIIIMLVVEAGMITPPIGINCYVVQGVRKGGSLNDVFIGMLPFLLAIIAVISLLVIFPEIALWLPNLLLG